MYKRLKEKKRKRKKENRWAVREIGDPVIDYSSQLEWYATAESYKVNHLPLLQQRSRKQNTTQFRDI